MNTSKLFNWIFIIPFLSVFISCHEKKASQSQLSGGQDKQPALNVNVLLVTTDILSADIEVPGTILANESTAIYPEVSGRLVQLNIREGAMVSRGALLAKLYDGDLQAQKRKLEVQLKIAEQTENRQAQLLKIQG
ncbi:MAG TPA: biotin/lipoyl-binding protein, partial [Chitinophagaceae bacterium]|nr:biotin/lipoyl-binding protein [Chitinophagaceae bacterium]